MVNRQQKELLAEITFIRMVKKGLNEGLKSQLAKCPEAKIIIVNTQKFLNCNAKTTTMSPLAKGPEAEITFMHPMALKSLQTIPDIPSLQEFMLSLQQYQTV